MMTNTFSDFTNVLHGEPLHFAKGLQVSNLKNLAIWTRQSKTLIDFRCPGWNRSSFEFPGIVQTLANPAFTVTRDASSDILHVAPFKTKVATKFRQVIGTHLPTVWSSNQVALIEPRLRTILKSSLFKLLPTQETWTSGVFTDIQTRLQVIYPKLFPLSILRRVNNVFNDLKGKGIFSVLRPVGLKLRMLISTTSKITKMLNSPLKRFTGRPYVGIASNCVSNLVNSAESVVLYSHKNKITSLSDKYKNSGKIISAPSNLT